MNKFITILIVLFISCASNQIKTKLDKDLIEKISSSERQLEMIKDRDTLLKIKIDSICNYIKETEMILLKSIKIKDFDVLESSSIDTKGKTTHIMIITARGKYIREQLIGLNNYLENNYLGKEPQNFSSYIDIAYH
ncbi:MAG: hypothetical protein WC069_07030 [Candidatus Shapirobacteria bacterium]